ncbi:MAG: hypothetical protein ACJ77K_08315 [Bacteroidia bacterium]
MIQRINTFFSGLENRFGLITAGFIIASIIIAFDMLYITPRFEAAYHGLQYSLLSNNPFDFSYANPIRNRPLPSIIGYIFFLRGDLFFIVPLIFALIFVATMYFYYRKKSYSPIDSFLFTGLIAFSSTVYIQLVAAGYTDVIFYFFIFLSFAYAEKIILSACFFSLALLTHESSLFLLPGLIVYSFYINKKIKYKALKHSIALIIAVLPLLIYRSWIAERTPVEYDLGFYFCLKNISFCIHTALPLLPAGAFYVFKLFWFFPVYVLYKTWKRKEFHFFYLILTIIIFDLSQLIIAFDITRMLCLGFPAILLSAEKVKTEWEPEKFTSFLFALTAFNFLILQYYVSSSGVSPLLPSPYTLLINLLAPNS